MSPEPRVEVVIDRLVVHGTTRAQARTIARDVETRLEQLAQGWVNGSLPPPSAGRQGRRRHPVAAEAGDADTSLGSRTADAVFATVTRPPPTSGPTRPREVTP